MPDWNDLDEELSAWRDRGLTATFWWRDDDAIEPTQPLTRMLDLVERYKAPLGLAVIPKTATPGLERMLTDHPLADVLQHGFSHLNNAPDGEKKAELGAHRERSVLLAELASGAARIRAFEFSQPVLVPPWNRIDSSILAHLPPLGFKAVSTKDRRKSDFVAPGLINIGAHADIIDWRGNRGFIGERPGFCDIINHLKARRLKNCGEREPTGIPTSQLRHEGSCWAFV